MMSGLELVGKRVFTYLVRRFFGQYLQTFDQEEFFLDCNKGGAVIENVALKVDALNTLIQEYNLPFEILHGYVNAVSIEVPWKAPFTESIVIEFHGAHLVVQPKKCAEDVSMFASMFESMASSLQLAEDCLMDKLETRVDLGPPIESVETIAKAIETVFSKMKIKFQDTIIRVESMLEDDITGVALEVKIKSAHCFDEAGVESASSENNNSSNQNSAYSIKKCMFEGISLYTAQFPASMQNPNQNCSTTLLSPGSPEMPPQHASLLIPKEEKVCEIKPVLISRIPGQQELRLKLKQDESVVGPKVDIEINLGCFNLFLSPYQVFMLIEIANGLTKPGKMTKNSCNVYQSPTANRPMDDRDYALVEQELLRQHEKMNLPSQSLQNQHGWSSHYLDESDQEFHLMKVESKTEIPLITEDLESSCSSVGSERLLTGYSPATATTDLKKSGKPKRSSIQAMLSDPVTESTQIHLSCSSISVLLLHDHKWTDESSNTEPNFNHSALNFQTLSIIAEKYFDDLAVLLMEGLNFKDFSAVRDKVSKLTKANHLRFIANGVTLDIDEKTSSSQRIFMTSLTLSDLEVFECLFNETEENLSKEPSFVQILSFKNEFLPSNNLLSGKEACLKMKYTQHDYGAQFRALKQPENGANKLVFQMAPFALDIDISLMNRIQSLLNPGSTFMRRNKKQEPFVFHWNDEPSIGSQSSPETSVQFSSSFVLLNLRFPIPDLRPYIDRLPWWQQNLRTEVLVMELTDASLSFVLDPEQSHQKIELQCRDFHGLFQVAPNERISFIRVSADPEAEKTVHEDGCFDWPRLVIKKVPQLNALCLDMAMYQKQEETYFASLHQESAVQSLMANMKKEPSPFSNSAVAFGSKFSNSSKENSISHDEIVKPAEKEKMTSFMNEIIDRSQYVLDFCLPRVNIVLPDKKFFELLYNRLSSDLMLWESTQMVPSATHEANGPMSNVFDLNLQPLKNNISLMSFKSCSDSNSESDDDVCTYHSVQGHSLKRSEVQHDFSDNHTLTKLSITMSVCKGSITIHCPHADSSQNLTDTCGRMQLCVEDSKFFVAASYKGRPNEAYICLLANKGHLYHDSSVPLPEYSIVPPFVSRPQNSSNLIIYPSESGVPSKLGLVVGKGGESMDVLSIAVHVVTNLKQQIKTFKMAIGVSGSTLRHYMAPSAELWLNQFSDFVNVSDYPILGYTPLSVVVELHLHLMNCAIDYRPLHLPLKTFSTFESFSLSTNITASTNSSLLRIISEELCLFLSNDMKTQSVDLKKGYVCVLDTGLIDVSVRVTNVRGGSEPKFEMCASNNMINIHTCADSCQALQKLIVYLAYYGDFNATATSPNQNQDVIELVKEANTPKEPESPPIPNNVSSLMAEAMQECSASSRKSTNSQSDSEPTDSDESFCIIEDDVGVGVLPKGGEPIIRVLTDEPIIIVDDYFKVPSGKSDLLKDPRNFPEPVLVQTLKEMSIIWHLYGGNDFPLAKKQEKKKVRYTSSSESNDNNLNSMNHDTVQSVRVNTNKSTVAFCKVTPLNEEFDVNAVHYSMEQVSIDPKFQSYDPRSWILKGGEGRDHSVLMEFQMNKVQFRHSEYPKDTDFVSRDVLLIHDFEIRDKLANSDFNKFLYQYSNESMPRQTHANMFLVKALRTRPDPKQPSEECSLNVSCKPLRMNVDQDALMFLYDFFKIFFEEPSDAQTKVSGHSNSPDSRSQGVSPSEQTVLVYPKSPTSGPSSYGNNNSTFFKSFSFSPDVLIRIDYKGKKFDFEQGAFTGFLMGFTELKYAEFRLKRLLHRHGLLGWERLLTYALNEWSEDIKRNQFASLIGGIGPMHAIIQLVQGLKDFLWCPVAQYRKDGQIVRGLQKGASSLSTSTAAAVLELTSQFVGLIQGAAVYAYDIVSPGPSVAYKLQGNINELRRPSQPADIREGMASAYNVMREGLEDTARTIVRVASVEHEHKGVRGAVGGVLRQIPPAAVKPIILGAEATCIVLGGAKHQLVPDAHKEAMDKWRTRNN